MSQSFSNSDMNGISSLIYRFNEETQEYDRVMAELLYMKKDNDAKLDIKSEGGVPDWIVPDMPVSMNVVWPSKGLVVFSGKVTYLLGNRVHIGDIQFMETIQRRKDVKVKYATRGALITPDRKTSFLIIFENISAGGVGFKMLTDGYSKNAVVPGAEFILEFEPEEEKIIQIPLHIIRTTGQENSSLIHAGAQFDSLRPGIETLIRQLVFRCQEEENTRERELRSNGMIEVDIFMKK